VPTIEASVRISKPPQIVAAALMNPGNAVFWTTDLERFEIISLQPGEVGSVAHLHYRQGEQTYIMEDVLEAMVPNQYSKSRVTGGGLTARVETWLDEIDAGTEMRIRWAGSGNNLRMKLALFLMRGAILRQTQSELDTFRGLVETHGARFGAEG